MSQNNLVRFENRLAPSQDSHQQLHDHGDGNFHAGHGGPPMHDHGDGNFHSGHGAPLMHDHGDGNFHAGHGAPAPFMHDHGDGNFHAGHGAPAPFMHDHGDGNFHSGHGNPYLEHGHSHEQLDHPGIYDEREPVEYDERDWSERAFTVGIGG
ncbi:hypothetical protein BC938DRAFT_476794 [Jimgerdemannia flammicorona]|uniref:Uncharacterized protein n=1 Tax=Jimgerdemannia flammicorona TaxID=994334 RepID=A0A433PEE9_9FUNG|nr:hypothetical protein BC938DRAFT_476794 [Jimgerdemannia flammicorona]